MHRPANPARANMETIRAIGLELSLWLVALIAHVAALYGARSMRLWVQDEVRHARRVARQYIFLHAFARIDAPRSGARGRRRPSNSKRGFRYARRKRHLVKHMLRGVDLSSLAAIRRAVEAVDTITARAARRFRWPATTGAWVATRPPARDLVRIAMAHAAAAADTS